MKYTTYLFDFDYTLADSSRGIVICFRNVLQRHGYKDITDTAIKRTIGKTLEDSFSILTGITDMEQLIALKEEYSEEENQHMNRNTRLFTDTLPTLHKLRRQGARIGIISTKNRFRIEEFMKMHLPQGWFDIIIGMEDVSRAKPDPEGLLLAIEKLKVSPGRDPVYRRQYRRRPNRRFGRSQLYRDNKRNDEIRRTGPIPTCQHHQ